MQALLYRFGLTEGEVADAVAEQFADVPIPGAAELSSTDVGVLSDAGLVIGPDAVAAGRRARTATLADQISLLMGPSTAQVAQAAGVSESRVRHWASGGALVAIRVGRGMRFPRFQFNADGHPLPGLAAALTAVPKEWPIAQVAAFMTTPQAELTLGSKHPLTPAQWLAAGGATHSVAVLLQQDW